MSNHFVVFAYVSLHTYIPKAHETELKVLSSSLRPHSPRDGVVVVSYERTATVKHRTLHVMRLTLVSKLYCSGSLALGSSHVKTWTFDLGLSIHRKFIMNDHFRYFLAGILDGHTQRLSQPRGSVIYANFRALL